MSADTKPFPAGIDLGYYHDVYHVKGGWERTHWWCVFDVSPEGVWLCNYVADEQTTDMLGTGASPRDAFESLVRRWTFANGGVVSPTLHALLPRLRAAFDDDGGINPAHLEVKG